MQFRQVSRANASEGEDHNFFQDSQFKPLTEISNMEVRFVAEELFSEFIYTLFILNITFFLFHITILNIIFDLIEQSNSCYFY